MLEEERERLIGQRRGKINIEETAPEILQYLGKTNKVFAKGSLQEKKVFIRQFVAGIRIFLDKEEGLVGFYAFPEVSNHLGKSSIFATMYAEGGT